jgi:hypothetical protein
VHGSPLLRAILVFLAILALGVPLWRLTHQNAAAAAAATPAPTEKKDIHLQLEFTQKPAHFAVLSLGKEIWSESAPQAEVERDLKIPFPKEGVDLELQIDWPEDHLSAARIHLTAPGHREMEKTVWGKGKTDEVVTFP